MQPGISMEHPFTVEGQLLTDVGGTLGFSVLSTPGMIGTGPTRLCRVGGERTATMLVYPHLEEGQATVGFEVCAKHVAGVGERTIGVGTHERRVVSRG